MTEKKLDIFHVLENADLCNGNFYSNLDEDMKKLFTPLVAMRWFSSVSDSSQFHDYNLLITNEIMNVNFWELTAHPELQWKLLALCGTGKKLRHGWIPMPKRKKINKIQEFMLKWYPSANDQELDLLTGSMNRDDFEQFVKSTGATDDELKELLKAHDNESGRVEEKVKTKRKKA